MKNKKESKLEEPGTCINNENLEPDDQDNRKRIEKIKQIKHHMGNRLLILAHHYQRQEVVDVGDHLGDSFALSKKAAQNTQAEFIVFCGVHFMAESAAILAGPNQIVQIPTIEAGCWMADMIAVDQVEMAWHSLGKIVGPNAVMPVVYVNSDANIKDFCGRNGGIACTSSNAGKALQWGLKRREKVLFMPDQHLGRNIGNRLSIPKSKMAVWDPDKPMGGNDPKRLQQAKLILWDGYCLVHRRFNESHIKAAREKFPEADIVVHPECKEEVVQMADAVGSTGYIASYVKDAPLGSTILIGTEINMIRRLAAEYPNKKILSLHHSLCPNMNKISIKNLLTVLEGVGRVNVITVPDDIKNGARMALQRMMDLK